MIRLDENKLKSLYPEMTPEFSARMDQLVHTLPCQREEPVMKRKLTAGVVFAIVLAILTVSGALAAGLGLFGQLSQIYPDERLQDLDALSTPVAQSFTTDDGVTVTIEQAYFDGSRLFIAYRKSGNISSVEMGDGMPEVDQWDMEFPGEAYGEAMGSISPDMERAADFLNRGVPGWVKHTSVSLHDGLFLPDGTYLDIINGDFLFQEDGSVVGWKECEVPEGVTVDSNQFKMVLFRSESIYYQDEKGLKTAFRRIGEETDIPFTVEKDVSSISLAGDFVVNDLYTAHAEMTLSRIDLKGTVSLRCIEDWYKAWEDWDYTPQTDIIDDWALYAGDEKIETIHAVEGFGAQAPNTLIYELTLRHGGKTENLKLVPVYQDSGEHPDEAIRLSVK